MARYGSVAAAAALAAAVAAFYYAVSKHSDVRPLSSTTSSTSSTSSSASPADSVGDGGESPTDSDDASLAVALERMSRLRADERRGRINAEIKLRKVSKALSDLQLSVVPPPPAPSDPSSSSSSSSSSLSSSPLQPPQHLNVLHPIGQMTTPYPLRTGTPRQGSLAPHGLAFLTLAKGVNKECLDGIEEYSHAWIIFKFHANTDVRVMHKSSLGKNSPTATGREDVGDASSSPLSPFHSLRSKIVPPRSSLSLPIGSLATRSPHRPNNVGLSLVSIRHFDRASGRLWLEGVDVVDGTPVYDVKPHVPWDVPTFRGFGEAALPAGNGRGIGVDMSNYRVPKWVAEDNQAEDFDRDATTGVFFDDKAREGLETLFWKGKLRPLYGVHRKARNNRGEEGDAEKQDDDDINQAVVGEEVDATSSASDASPSSKKSAKGVVAPSSAPSCGPTAGTLDDAIAAITEVLMQDPRQTRRRGKASGTGARGKGGKGKGGGGSW